MKFTCEQLWKFVAAVPIEESTFDQRQAIMEHGAICPECRAKLLDGADDGPDPVVDAIVSADHARIHRAN